MVRYNLGSLDLALDLHRHMTKENGTRQSPREACHAQLGEGRGKERPDYLAETGIMPNGGLLRKGGQLRRSLQRM